MSAAGARPDGQHLTWAAALALFIGCWQAEHPGIRPGALGHYREQVETRPAVFATQRDIARVESFGRYDLRAFVGWLDQVVTYAERPLMPRGKQMALDTAKRLLSWLHHEGLMPEDITAHIAKYRLDRDSEPRATPVAAVRLGTYSSARPSSRTCNLRRPGRRQPAGARPFASMPDSSAAGSATPAPQASCRSVAMARCSHAYRGMPLWRRRPRFPPTSTTAE